LGVIFAVDIRELRSGRHLVMIKLTDYTDSFTLNMFSRTDQDQEKFQSIRKGIWVKVRGSIQTDNYTNELTMMLNDLMEIKHEPRKDLAEAGEKRVELHSHSMMSQMDSVAPISKLVERAADWGLPAIAITYHAAVQH